MDKERCKCNGFFCNETGKCLRQLYCDTCKVEIEEAARQKELTESQFAPFSEIMMLDKAIREIKKIDIEEMYKDIKAKMDAADKEPCTGNCGMSYCDDNGCIERIRHPTVTLPGNGHIPSWKHRMDQLKYNSPSHDVEYPSHKLQQTQAGLPMTTEEKKQFDVAKALEKIINRYSKYFNKRKS